MRPKIVTAVVGIAVALAAVAYPLKRNVKNLHELHSSPQPLERTPIERFGSARLSTEAPRILNNDPVALALNGDARWAGGDTTGARIAWAAAGDYHRLMAAGAFLQKRRDLDAAESMYGSAVAVRPSAPAARLAVAALQWNRGRKDAATKTYEAMIARYPRDMGDVPYASLATIYAEQGQFERAGTVLTRGLGYWPKSIALRTTAGMVDAWAGRLDPAVQTLTAVLAEKPDANDACYWLGWTYARGGNDGEAVRQFAECLARTPNDPKTLYQQGIAFQRLNDRPSARTAFLRLLSISPNDAPARDRLRETEQTAH